jgi:transcriptional regulator with XRE-family HTH domain
MAAGSTVPRRQLGRELKRLRSGGNFKVEQVTGKFGWSRSKLFRIEKGQVPVSRTDVMALCQLYRADDKLVDAMIALADESKRKGWWHAYGEAIPDWFELYVGLESTASRMRQYSTELVPGLLQTADYATAVSEAARIGAGIQAQVQVRLTRQSILTREDPAPPRLDVVLNESVLRRVVGSRAVMVGQLRKLLDAIEGLNVTIRILPFEAGAHAGMMGSYLMLSFPDDDEPDIVYLETPIGALYLEKPSELARYGVLFGDARERALEADASRDLIEATMKEYRR